MRYSILFLPLLLLTLTFVTPVTSQSNDCPALVEAALEATGTLCSGTGRNQVCYGNAEIVTRSRPEAADFVFAAQGDIADAAWIESMRLSQLNLNEGVWGVSLMRLQANLPDTLPGQNVTFLLFGDVEVTNRVPLSTAPTLQVTTTSNLRARTSPSDTSPTSAWLTAGTIVTANGRLPDNSWLRLQAALGSGSLGWVYAPLLEAEGDIATLEPVDVTDSTPRLGAMQAIYLKTGSGEVACENAPRDGMLIQTPEGAGTVQVQINGVEIELGSTAYVRTTADNAMELSIVEGSARMSVMDETRLVVPGAVVSLPLDDNLNPTGSLSDPAPYDEAAIQSLPLSLLERAVRVYPPMSAERLAQISRQFEAGNVVCGAPPLTPCSSTASAVSNSGSVGGSNNPNSDDSSGTRSSDSGGQGSGENGTGNGNANGNSNGNANGNSNGNANGNGGGDQGSGS